MDMPTLFVAVPVRVGVTVVTIALALPRCHHGVRDKVQEGVAQKSTYNTRIQGFYTSRFLKYEMHFQSA